MSLVWPTERDMERKAEETLEIVEEEEAPIVEDIETDVKEDKKSKIPEQNNTYRNMSDIPSKDRKYYGI